MQAVMVPSQVRRQSDDRRSRPTGFAVILSAPAASAAVDESYHIPFSNPANFIERPLFRTACRPALRQGAGLATIIAAQGEAMAVRLKAKTAIVFGAGSSGPDWGNGKAAAVAFARGSAGGVRRPRRDGGCRNRRNHHGRGKIITGEGGAAIAVAADVTQSGSVEAAVAQMLARFGRIDILHNNVGVTQMGGPVELSEEQFQLALDLNIGSVYRTAKAILPHMLRHGNGGIVNISSLAAIRWTGYPYFAYYAAEAAVNQATVALAMQYARRGVRANCIMPGIPRSSTRRSQANTPLSRR
jgi:NAD(P)-dependent dehydrogenase (short-subunit alcohol dehydrogenase family)